MRNINCPFCGYKIDRIGCLQRNTNYNGKTVHVPCLERRLIAQKRLKEMEA